MTKSMHQGYDRSLTIPILKSKRSIQTAMMRQNTRGSEMPEYEENPRFLDTITKIIKKSELVIQQGRA